MTTERSVQAAAESGGTQDEPQLHPALQAGSFPGNWTLVPAPTPRPSPNPAILVQYITLIKKKKKFDLIRIKITE